MSLTKRRHPHMKKTKSFFAVISLAALLSISACSGLLPNSRESSENSINQSIDHGTSAKESSSEIYLPEAFKIYQLYLAEGGKLSYEEWLATVRGEKGEPGHTYEVTIGENGNWFIDGKDTGIHAQGEKGDKGDTGEKGETGDKGDKGDTGKSAYEKYKEAHPEYNKTEEEWLDDLLNGRLGIQITHTVSFNTNGGSEVANQTVNHGEKANKPADPTRDGYTFEGWYYQNEPWSFVCYVVTEDMVIEAKWKAIDYTATFFNDDGTVLDGQENVHYGDQLTYNGETPVKPNPEDHYAYTFKGWDKELTVNGDMAFTAQYDKVYAPYEEKYYDYADNLIYSRFVSEEGNLSNNAVITWKNQNKKLNDVVRFEAEDAYFEKGIDTYHGESCSGKTFIGGFQDRRTALFTFECNANVSVDLIFNISRPDTSVPLTQCWKINVNGRTVDLGTLMTPVTDSWESFTTYTGVTINLKQGTNNMLITAADPINIDYIDMKTAAQNDVSAEIEVPNKPTENNIKYQFHGWDLLSDENNVRSYKAHYEAATSGLEFNNNEVEIYHGTAKDVIIPSWWDGVTITKIGKGAFASTAIKSVTLPDSILTIGEQSFMDAAQLTTINFPSSLKLICYEAFTRCPSLEHVSFNEGLEKMESRAFEGAGLKEVILPSTLTYIGDNALGGLYADYIFVPSTVVTIDWHCFYSPEGRTNQVFCEREYRPTTFDPNWALRCDVTWGYKGMIEENGYKYAISEIDSVTALKFVGVDSSVTDVAIPNAVNDIPVTSVSSGAFAGNKTIKTVALPNCVTEIAEKMFFQCDNLEGVTIPDSVTSIGRYAFANCPRLKSIVMPNSVTEVGDHCFENCVKLESVTLSTSLKVITEGMFKDCDSLTFIEIPEGVESTQFGIVESADNVKSIVFPSTLKSLANQTFFYNWGIDNFYLKISPEAWNAILETYINDYDGIDRPTVYYYSEEAPTEFGNYWHYVNGVPTVW